MVITYRLNPLSWWLVRKRIYVSYAGMPNILAGEKIVPEFLQDQATPENLSEAVVTLLRDRAARERLDSRFEAIRAVLRQNTDEKAASAIMPLLGGAALP
jgi:lipid-A-disaccharide synthase